jgi:chorismate mutase/prephenate dehydratase
MAERGQRSPAAAVADAAEALDRLRARIDAIDGEILDRLNERAHAVQSVGRLKSERQLPVYEEARERHIVERLVAANPGPYPDGGIAPVFREIISATRSLEEVLRVAYFGSEGTFSHQAARRRFGEMADLQGFPSIGDVFGAVERGRVALGVVPVENTTEGIVTQTYDALARSELTLCGEVQLRISHNLLSRSGRMADVTRVASHPQPLAQCRRWLDVHLRDVERVETPSTTAAARLAAEDAGVAAIASSIAAEVYELRTIEAAIEDRRDNTTRFLVIGRTGPAATGDDMTSAVYTIRKDESGALFRLLEPFARCGVNLTSLQLRPIEGKPWEYLFFLDLEGHRDEAKVREALAGAAAVAHSHRVLGSFPRSARPPER